MRNPLRWASTLLVCLIVSGCATTDTAQTIDGIVADGGEIVDPRDLIGDTGITYVDIDNAWVNYLGPDGRKVVKVEANGVLKRLTWRTNDAGEFCQQMFSTEKEACNNLIIVKDKGGTYNSYNKADGKLGARFTIVEGNPEGL
jgi:hypothetical protein